MTRTRMLAVGGGLLLLVVVVAVVFAATRNPEAEEVAAPTESPSAVPTPSPTPSAAPTRVVEQPQPFKVRLDRVVARPLHNAEIFGNRLPSGKGKPRGAAKLAAARLQRYLNAQFVRRSSRFTAAPVRDLLTSDARALLGPKGRAALGVGHRNIIGGKTRGATTDAIVLHRGPRVESVTLRFIAGLTVVRKGGTRERWSQRGSLVLMNSPTGWKAALADVRLVQS